MSLFGLPPEDMSLNRPVAPTNELLYDPDDDFPPSEPKLGHYVPGRSAGLPPPPPTLPPIEDVLNPCVDAVHFETIEIPGPGLKYDQGKVDWTLTPWRSVEAIVRVLMFGEQKYARNSWQNVDGGKRRYLAATFRHLTAHCLGEETDEESGFSHLAHAGACILFLIHLHNETK